MKRFFLIFTAVCLCFSLCSCKKNDEYPKTEFFTMNTYAVIAADGADQALLADIKENVLALEKRYSRTYADSELSSLTSGMRLPSDTAELLLTLSEISENTNGAFDFTLGQLSALWNVTGEGAHVPTDEAVTEALSHCGYSKVRLDEEGIYYCDDPALKLDLGAAVKGYAGQRQADTLRREGIRNAAVNLGGNVTVIGSSPENRKKGINGWNVGINNPFDTNDLLGTLLLSDATVSVSGSYERYFEENGVRYHHILDSVTGYPAESGLISVAVIAKDGLYADALSTALFVLGYEGGMAFYEEGRYDFEAIFCTEDGEVKITSGLKDLFIPNEKAEKKSGESLSFRFIQEK